MRLIIHRDLLNEPKHLLYDTAVKTFGWVGSIEDDMWVVGGKHTHRSVETLIRLAGTGSVPKIDPSYKNILDTFLREDKDAFIRWRFALTNKQFKNLIQGLLAEAENAVSMSDIGYYIEFFLRTVGFLDRLASATINEKRFNELRSAEKNPTTRSTLQSFIPCEDQKCKRVVYDQLSTITGRLKVSSGPRILTLPKEARNIIKSSSPEGKIKMIDFVSLEPRIALALASRPAPADIYSDINSSIFGGSFDRDKIKLLSIAALYGAQEDTFINLSGMQRSDAWKVMADMRSYFNIRHVQAKLQSQLAELGYIMNAFGRRIRPKKEAPRILYNYYIQSTAVDAALLGFSDLIDRAREAGVEIEPLFVIHDALMVDVKNYQKKHDDILSASIRVERFDEVFPLSISSIE